MRKHLLQHENAADAKINGVVLYCCFGFADAVGIAQRTSLLSSISFMNALSYWLYAQDKKLHSRVDVVFLNNLHIVAFLGGWPAAWLAQQNYAITQKQPFGKIYFLYDRLNILSDFMDDFRQISLISNWNIVPVTGLSGALCQTQSIHIQRSRPTLFITMILCAVYHGDFFCGDIGRDRLNHQLFKT